MFENFWKQVQKYEKEHPIKYVNIRPAMNPFLNHNTLMYIVSNADNIPTDDLRYVIQNNFFNIIDEVYKNKVDYMNYVNAFKNLKFLDIFIETYRKYSSRSGLNDEYLIKMDIIIYYHMHTLDMNNINDTIIANRLYILCQLINHFKILQLKKYHIPEILQYDIILSRYSSTNAEEYINRLNNVLVTNTILLDIFKVDYNCPIETQNGPIEFMSDLLSKIFDLNEWVRIFPYFMKYTYRDIPNNDSYSLKLYELISFSLLNLLDSKIYKLSRVAGILTTYYSEFYMLYYKKNIPVRFSFSKISLDKYNRLKYVIDNLRYNQGIILP